MVLEGFEAIAIVAIVAIVFLWGPDKLPEIAKAMAEAKREFDKASKEASKAYQQAIALPPTTATSPDSASQPALAPPPADAVIVAAKSMGISTEGKTREELVKETIERSMKK